MSHLYVCHFSSGHIKVGRSIDPVARVAQHADRVACVGIELVEYRTFECAGDAFMAEAALIERCDTECTRRLKSEWFEGLTFESACEWACGCAKTDFQAAHMSKITVKDLGGPTRVARVLGLAAPSVHGWRNGIPADHCPALERESGGNFTVEQMRPDVRWHRVPDPAWPHPDGRPLIDVAEPAATTAA